MMIEETDTVLIEEAVTSPLMGDMVVGDLLVHIAEVGVAQTMAMDQIRLPDQNQEEVPNMNETKAHQMGDMTGLLTQNSLLFLFGGSFIPFYFDYIIFIAADHPHLATDLVHQEKLIRIVIEYVVRPIVSLVFF